MNLRLDTLLATRNMSLFRLSKESGVPYATLHNFHAGKYVPKTPTLKKVADCLGVSVDYFLKGEESAPAEPETPEAKMAARMQEDPDFKALCYSLMMASPETVRTMADVLDALKRRER